MKRLYILRHAKAEKDGIDDKSRALSPRGVTQSRHLGQILKEQNYAFDHAFVSSAVRTKMTFENLQKTYEDNIPYDLRDDLYNAGTGDIFEAIKRTEESVNALLIVGHNPGIHQIAGTLTGQGEEAKIQDLMINYKPGTLTLLDLDIEGWAHLKPHSGALIDLIPPQA